VGVEPLHADSEPESILLHMLVSEPDVVVVVLRPETPRRDGGQDAAYTWDAAAQLVRIVRDTGTPVIAVSMGGSAAALAVCVEQGAVGVLHVDLLPQELDRQAARHHNTNGAASQNGHDDPNRASQLPGPYDALVHLTPSERRVLFHMMEGRSAADIATILVVSLTTVRSHIRSILRKLNVNSQLAAVALAFGTLPDPAVTD
jgi:DNA-binding NarL/FixJ family response regulator